MPLTVVLPSAGLHSGRTMLHGSNCCNCVRTTMAVYSSAERITAAPGLELAALAGGWMGGGTVHGTGRCTGPTWSKQPASIAVAIASKLIGSLALVGRSDVVSAVF